MGRPRRTTAPAQADDAVEETPEPDTEETSTDVPPTEPDATPADAESQPPADTDAATAPAQADDTEAEPADEVTIVMNIAISGLRNGEPWPSPGGEISLPTEEAETYVRLGYAREA